jgi:predicted O-linked N-acetylglucosamine transferase (SPINDLY family)
LRIGYVSPDFRSHALVRYFEPVLIHHNSQQVETFCYAEVPVPDDTTRRLQTRADHWIWTCKLSDAQLAQRIREDRIDILVDLAGHTAGNRLLMFALKPAPIQATWLGYLNTTSLKTMDYRFSDVFLDPPGFPVRDTEEIFRLPSGFCCMGAPTDSPDVAPVPALARGYMTFGSLNNSFKLNHKLYDLWARVLRELPTSRLLMYRDSLTATVREQLRHDFAERGIDGQRLDLRQWSGDPRFLEVYHEIDVCLDTFPFTGGVTTCEALWMGVPVVSLAGQRPMGRHSTSLLSRVGLSDWAVDTPDAYVKRAVQAAQDLEGLAQIRAVLRERMQATVCNAAQLTRELEEAYRVMWRRWLEQNGRRDS